MPLASAMLLLEWLWCVFLELVTLLLAPLEKEDLDFGLLGFGDHTFRTFLDAAYWSWHFGFSQSTPSVTIFQ